MDKNPKNQEDEEFEKLLRDFIDNDIDLDGDPEEDEETEDHDDQYDENLPFPKPMNDRVAEIKLGKPMEKRNAWLISPLFSCRWRATMFITPMK